MPTTEEEWLALEDQNRCECGDSPDCPHQAQKFAEGATVKVTTPFPLEAPEGISGRIGRVDMYSWDCGRWYVHVVFGEDGDGDYDEQHFAEWELERAEAHS